MASPDAETFAEFCDEHPELGELSDRVLDDLVEDSEAYDRGVALGWFESRGEGPAC